MSSMTSGAGSAVSADALLRHAHAGEHLAAMGDEDAPASPDDIILLRNVHKTYLLGVEGVPAVRGISLSVKRGEMLVILGKSGGGKTTLLNLMSTIDKPTRGDVFLAGTRVTADTPDSVLARVRLLRIGVVFQSFNLIDSMTAVENVELPLVLAGWGSASQRRERAVRLLRLVGLGDRIHHTPSQMSGGEQQRTTIARSLVNKPDVLLLDEVTGDLDARNTDMVMGLLTHLNDVQGVTQVMVTHDVSQKVFAHRVVHILDGKVVRVERVPKAVRDRAIADLHARPHVVSVLQQADRADRHVAATAGPAGTAPAPPPAATPHLPVGSAGDAAQGGGREAAGERPAPRARQIVLRRPVSYAVHRFTLERMQTRYGVAANGVGGRALSQVPQELVPELAALEEEEAAAAAGAGAAGSGGAGTPPVMAVGNGNGAHLQPSAGASDNEEDEDEQEQEDVGRAGSNARELSTHDELPGRVDSP